MKIKDKKEITKLLYEYVYSLIFCLPDDVAKNSPDVTFFFEQSGVRFIRGSICFATTQDIFGGKEITFYVDNISRTGTTKQGLMNLIFHEFAHALGMNEEEATKLTTNLKKRL